MAKCLILQFSRITRWSFGACDCSQSSGLLEKCYSQSLKLTKSKLRKNAVALAETLIKRGLRIVSGRTESHVMLVDLRAKGITGKVAEEALGNANITTNKMRFRMIQRSRL